MNEMRRNLLVGSFALVGLGILGLLVVLFGQQAGWFARGQYRLNVRFDSAAGIRTGTLVTVNGIRVGTVGKVGFVDVNNLLGGAYVEVRFDRGLKFTKGTQAETTEPGLGAGRPPILITPGPLDAPALASGEFIPGRMVKAIDSLIPREIVSSFDRTATQVGEAAAALSPVLKDLHEMIQPRDVTAVDLPAGPPGNLATAAVRLDAMLKHFNEVLGDPQVKSQLKGGVDNLHTMTEEGKQMMADLRVAAADAKEFTAGGRQLVSDTREAVGRIDARTAELARALLEALQQASLILTQLNGAAQKVNSGEGTIGRFVNDDRLYEAMVLTFRRLAETTEELRILVKDWQQGKVRVSAF